MNNDCQVSFDSNIDNFISNTGIYKDSINNNKDDDFISYNLKMLTNIQSKINEKNKQLESDWIYSPNKNKYTNTNNLYNKSKNNIRNIDIKNKINFHELTDNKNNNIDYCNVDFEYPPNKPNLLKSSEIDKIQNKRSEFIQKLDKEYNDSLNNSLEKSINNKNCNKSFNNNNNNNNNSNNKIKINSILKRKSNMILNNNVQELDYKDNNKIEINKNNKIKKNVLNKNALLDIYKNRLNYNYEELINEKKNTKPAAAKQLNFNTNNNNNNINKQSPETTSIINEDNDINFNLKNSQSNKEVCSFNFPEFKSIDEVVNNDKDKLNLIEFFKNTNKYTSIEEIIQLLHYVNSKDIKILPLKRINIKSLWYKHKDIVYFGEIINYNYNESLTNSLNALSNSESNNEISYDPNYVENSKVYIKKISIKLKKHLKFLYSELKLLIELKKSNLFDLEAVGISCYIKDEYSNNERLIFNQNINYNCKNVSLNNKTKRNDVDKKHSINSLNKSDKKNTTNSFNCCSSSNNNYYNIQDVLDYEDSDMDLSFYLIFNQQYMSFDQFVKKNKKKSHKFAVLKHVLKTFLILHSRGILYLDLKPDMIQLDKSLNIRIFDFYNARLISDLIKQQTNKKQLSKVFYTPYFCAPEITLCNPKVGWAQDIFSLGCLMIVLFLKHENYDECSYRILLKRVFNSTANYIKEGFSLNNRFFYTRIPNIPKEIDKQLALIISKCFNIDPLKRIDILDLINLVNEDIFKKNSLIKDKYQYYKIEVKHAVKLSLEKSKELNKSIYLTNKIDIFTSSSNNSNNNISIYNSSFDDCTQHIKNNNANNNNNSNNTEIINNNINNNNNQIEYYKKQFKCESCKGKFYCYMCILESHSIHVYQDMRKYYEVSEIMYFDKIKEIENNFLSINFFKILNLQTSFLYDYNVEKEKIIKEYNQISNSLDDLKYKQLKNLNNSKEMFLSNKFKGLFELSNKISKHYYDFYECKYKFQSIFNRFDNNLNSFREFNYIHNSVKKNNNYILNNINSNNNSNSVVSSIANNNNTTNLIYKNTSKFNNNKINNTTNTNTNTPATTNIVSNMHVNSINNNNDILSPNIKKQVNTTNINKTLINFVSYVSFSNKYKIFASMTEKLKKCYNKIVKCSSVFDVSGKYKYSVEKYSLLLIESLNDINKRIDKENHKFFDYAGSDTLFIPYEIVNIIPYTNKVFSYMKNNFKLLQVSIIN